MSTVKETENLKRLNFNKMMDSILDAYQMTVNTNYLKTLCYVIKIINIESKERLFM